MMEGDTGDNADEANVEGCVYVFLGFSEPLRFFEEEGEELGGTGGRSAKLEALVCSRESIVPLFKEVGDGVFSTFIEARLLLTGVVGEIEDT